MTAPYPNYLKLSSIIFCIFLSFAAHTAENKSLESSKLDSSAKPNKGVIVGHCTVAEGNGNMMANSCPMVLLLLQNQEGKTIAHARSNLKGNFAFTDIAEKGPFKIVSGGKLYEVNDDKKEVGLNEEIHVVLKQKSQSL